MTITGGIVIAKAGNQGDVQNRAIGPGHNNDDYGTLNIGYEMMVGAGNNGSVERIVDGDERMDACWYRSYAEISPCTHPGATYTVSSNDAYGTHTMLCSHCTTTFNAEPHELNETGECSVCHYKGEAYTVIIYLPDADEDGKYTKDGAYKPYAYGIVAGTAFTLPGAPQDLYDMEFAGWLVTTDAVPSFSTYKASADEALLAESTEYTPNGDVSFVARYKDIAINLADNSDNAETLYNYDGRKVASVTLEVRTLYKDGKWNTLCLPFYLADGDTDPGHSPVVGGIDGKTFTGTQLEGAEVMGYDHAEFDSRSGTLELIFGPLFTVPAGEPFVH